MKVLAWISALALAACGGGPDPILRNVPQPNTAAIAGAAAAAAGAATLASPHDAAKRQEKNKAPDEKKPIEVKQTVPSDVLDRLDAKQQAGSPGDERGRDDKRGQDDKKAVPGEP
jgi:hypothetical protein